MKTASLAVVLCLLPTLALAQSAPKGDETLLGEFVVTGSGGGEAPLPKIAILPSLAPDLEDVTVRSVVRRDFELSGMYQLISEKSAPPGLYGFEDAVDVEAWKKLGAESIVKVAARRVGGSADKIEVFGLAYFPSVGADPVYQKKLVVGPSELRVTAHRITDALIGALTGRPGAFASEFVFSGREPRVRRIYRMDADGFNVRALTEPAHTAITPAWGPEQSVYYADSLAYSPYSLRLWKGGKSEPVKLQFNTSIYSLAVNKEKTRLALAVGDQGGSSIWVGNLDGSDMKKVSTTPVSTSPAFGPKGQLAWVGGGVKNGGQRIYVDGKVVSPPGFTAASPTFCDTEDGVRILYSVGVGNDRQDLIMSDEKGKNVQRLTQNQGTNQYPACSPDGRLIAFSSTRNKTQGIYFMTIKRWRAIQLDDLFGESLRWDPLPASKGAPL